MMFEIGYIDSKNELSRQIRVRNNNYNEKAVP